MSQRILVTGVSGFLGSRIAEFLVAAGHSVVGTWHRHPERVPAPALAPASANDAPAPAAARGQCSIAAVPLDLLDLTAIERVVEELAPEAIVHTAALPDLRLCEDDPEQAHAVNVVATEALARAARQVNASFIFTSTDQVFDGRRPWVTEQDPVAPLHHYGRTKAEAEQRVLAIDSDRSTVVRVCLVYGRSPSGRRSASEQVVNALAALSASAAGSAAGPGQAPPAARPRLFTDEFRTPILVDDLASAIGQLVERHALPGAASRGEDRRDVRRAGPLPILHLGGPDRVSRYDLGVAIARRLGHSEGLIEPVSLADLNWSPPRPPDLSLDTALARQVLSSPPRGVAAGLLIALKRGEG